MHIRSATERDLPLLLPLYRQARAFMRSCGNQAQWINGYPSASLLQQDIAASHLYICLDGCTIAAAFCWRPGPDPTYRRIEQGRWLDEQPYYVVHRLAVNSPGWGVGSFCLRWCLQQNPRLRIDTHRDNAPMQKLLLKNGFHYCGIIYTEDGSPRLAYQYPPLAPAASPNTALAPTLLI